MTMHSRHRSVAPGFSSKNSLKTPSRGVNMFSKGAVLFAVLGFIFCVIVACNKSGIFSGSVPVIFTSSPSTSDVEYGIVMDAGSSGSRIHIYSFRKTEGGAGAELLHDEFVQLEPGVSSYKEDPPMAGKSIQPLLDHAIAFVPKELHSKTPVFLKATAGLRLLEGDLPERLLEAIRDTLQASPFIFHRDWANVIDGIEEGLFAWVTVNYLLGNLGKAPQETVGIMDLGGGSTQIVYAVEKPETGADMQILSFGGVTYNVFAHSYLGYGLNSAHDEIQKLLKEKAVSTSDPEAFVNPCAPQGHPQAVGVPSGDFDECRELVNDLFDLEVVCTLPPCSFGGIHQPAHSGDFFTFSFYYDRTVVLGLMDADEPGDIGDFGRDMCARTYSDLSAFIDPIKADVAPRVCLDLAYIYELLTTGMKFGDDQKRLRIQKKVNGFEIGWAVGAMLNEISLGRYLS